PATVTLAAGGSADVVVTVDSRGDTPDGAYTGALIATGGDLRVVTPIAIEREPESYDLTLRALDGTGAPALAFVQLSPGSLRSRIVDGETTLRLLRGNYVLSAAVLGADVSFLAYPGLVLTGDASVVLDGQRARPFAVTIPGQPLDVTSVGWLFFDARNDRIFSEFGLGVDVRAGHLGPEVAPDAFVSWAWTTALPVGTPTDGVKEVYQLARVERGHMITGWSQVINERELATVQARQAGEDGVIYEKGSIALVEDRGVLRDSLLLGFFPVIGPFERTEHYYGSGVRWEQVSFDSRETDDDSGFPDTVATERLIRSYRPGQHTVELWNQAPFGPAFAERLVAPTSFTALRLLPTASRTGNTLRLEPSMVSGQGSPAHRVDTTVSQQRSALFRNGVLIAEQIDPDDPLPTTDVPPGTATYRFEQEVTRPEALFPLSTHVAAAWTFRSQRISDEERVLPLPTLRFQPRLDDHNRSTARVALMQVAIERPPGAPTPRIAHARI
ncbi:MAG: hypothetical protein IAG13_13055, partial [Deltaproteobacteria bacterium]|nr:hypothetical protein [Nannocystaceae bacterium]